MGAQDTREALAASIRQAWDRQFSKASNTEVDRVMARVAVDDVVSALRANPAWCRSLGIGADL